MAIFVTGAVVSRAEPPDGCGPVGPITESKDFTPENARRTHLPEFPLTTAGRPASEVDAQPSSIDDLPLRWSYGEGGKQELYLYFLGGEMGDLTVAEFRAAGSIQLDRDPVSDGDPYTANDVIAQVGDRAVKVQIGDYEGALVWADPESNGVRPHNLYWSDGTYNFGLIAVREPERIVTLARELVCEG